jgi:hypothetical protein
MTGTGVIQIHGEHARTGFVVQAATEKRQL